MEPPILSNSVVTARLRLLHVGLQAVQIPSFVCHFLAQRLLARTGHGCCVKEIPGKIPMTISVQERAKSTDCCSRSDSQSKKMYLFLMQMAQLPLILVGRASVFKRHPGIGNVRPSVFFAFLLGSRRS